MNSTHRSSATRQMQNRDALRARQAAQPLATPEYAVAAPGYPSGGPTGQRSRRKVRRACPSGGPAGQSSRRKVRRTCPSGGPAGQERGSRFCAPKVCAGSRKPPRENAAHLQRTHSLRGRPEFPSEGCAAPPARSVHTVCIAAERLHARRPNVDKAGKLPRSAN